MENSQPLLSLWLRTQIVSCGNDATIDCNNALIGYNILIGNHVLICNNASIGNSSVGIRDNRVLPSQPEAENFPFKETSFIK